MKNRAWMFLLLMICGSFAALSAFAHPAEGEFYAASNQEISNDEATTDRMNAEEESEEAAATCEDDCVKDETDLCDAKYDPTNHLSSQRCLQKVPDYCQKKCN